MSATQLNKANKIVQERLTHEERLELLSTLQAIMDMNSAGENENPRLLAALRDQNSQLQEEKSRLENLVDDLTRKIERSEIWTSADAAGIHARSLVIDREIARIQSERDIATRDVIRIVTAIETTRNQAELLYNEVTNSEDFTLLQEVAGQQKLPALADAIWNIRGMVLNTKAELRGNALRTAMQELGVVESDAYKFPELSLRLIWHYVDLTASLTLTLMDVMSAYGLAHDSRLVADMILRQCRTAKEPSMNALYWLTDEWIASNLPNPPAKRETLQEALKIIRAQQVSGHNQQQYSSETGIPARTLRKYQSWWDALEVAATLAPPLVKAFAKDID